MFRTANSNSSGSHIKNVMNILKVVLRNLLKGPHSRFKMD